jgi:hypothetical protein
MFILFSQDTIDRERRNMVIEAMSLCQNEGHIPTGICRIIGCAK